tara:strand:+ start:1191 stop:1703 length:513 start_codon:yes stop_codon:yes gene_type:complete
MKSNKNIVLVGMMGSGKSSIGKLLSKKTGLDFIDIDALIEKKENKSITEIFKVNGEKYFRDLEEKISIKKLQEYNNVISLGGGAFLNAKIRKKSSLNSITVWLNWKTSTLIDRIKDSKKRPVVTNLKANEIKDLIEERSKIYNSSDYKVNCDKLSKSEIINKIKNFYENT